MKDKLLTAQQPAPAELARRLAISDRLRRRHFQLLPLTGPDAVFTDVQGRLPGDATSPASLADLISSIASIGVLQPVLVEELGPNQWRLVAGERRLRAAKWVATEMPDDLERRFLPAVVCPGPLSEEERRVWQLVENLAREDLQPGELAAALLFERSAVLATNLLAAGVPVPAEVFTDDDPVRRYKRLEGLRPKHGHVGAPWEQVLRRLGLQVSERQARAVVSAFAAMPAELSADMDAHKVKLTTRLAFLRLGNGVDDAAEQLWAAVRGKGRPELLYGAVRACSERPGLDPEQYVALAEEERTQANLSRSEVLRAGVDEPSFVTDGEEIAADDVAMALNALKALLTQLRAGRRVGGYSSGSLKLLADELSQLLIAGSAEEPELAA